MKLLGIFSGLLWLIPLLLLAGLIYSLFRLAIVRRGGTKRRDKDTGRYWFTKEKPPYHTIYSFWTSIILFVALIATLIAMISDK